MIFKELENRGLIKQYYVCPEFRICRVADHSIMAIWSRGDHTYDSDGDISSTTYMAWNIDREFGQKIIENNALFVATLVSKQTARVPDMKLCTNDAVSFLSKVRDEVASGTRPCIIDPEFENSLKKIHMNEIEKTVAIYGDPPAFSNRKVWMIVLSFLLYPLGLPWFMAGDRKGGVISLGLLVIFGVLTVVMPLAFAFLIFVVVRVFVFYYKLFTGKIKDENGLPILTKAKQTQIIAMIDQYNAYKMEFGW